MSPATPCIPYFQKLKLPFLAGTVRREPLLDWIFVRSFSQPAGPFQTVSNFHNYYTLTIGPNTDRMDYRSLSPHPYRSMLPDDVPIVFTHADLHPSNIILSPNKETGSRVATVVDWQQSGWYPAYWEYCKACWTTEIGPEWREKHTVFSGQGRVL